MLPNDDKAISASLLNHPELYDHSLKQPFDNKPNDDLRDGAEQSKVKLEDPTKDIEQKPTKPTSQELSWDASSSNHDDYSNVSKLNDVKIR